MLTSYIIRARPCKHSDVISLKYTDIRGGSLDWISGFQSGFLDFRLDFWISEWISGFRWISGFQIGFLPTVYEISFVADPSVARTVGNDLCTRPIIGQVQSNGYLTKHSRNLV